MKNGETISYLWEIDLSSTNTLGTLAESLKFNIQTQYSAENSDCFQNLNFEFIIDNYKVKIKYLISILGVFNLLLYIKQTLMLMESEVEMASKSGEFCRMNTVCTYTVNFKRTENSNSPPSEISLKYEIVVDKTMWAICGRGSGMFK